MNKGALLHIGDEKVESEVRNTISSTSAFPKMNLTLKSNQYVKEPHRQKLQRFDERHQEKRISGHIFYVCG